MRKDLEASCDDAGIPHKEMVRSVQTRWNSLTEAIRRALDLRAALEKLLSLPKYEKGKSKLTKYKLSSAEWTLLEQLWKVLDVSI